MAACGLGFLVSEGSTGPSEHHCRRVWARCQELQARVSLWSPGQVRDALRTLLLVKRVVWPDDVEVPQAQQCCDANAILLILSR